MTNHKKSKSQSNDMSCRMDLFETNENGSTKNKLHNSEDVTVDQLLESNIIQEASEGLSMLKENEIVEMEQELNLLVRTTLAKSKKSKHRLVSSNKWTFIALFTILLMIVLGYFIVYVSIKNG
jgi:hypothetical protein